MTEHITIPHSRVVIKDRHTQPLTDVSQVYLHELAVAHRSSRKPSETTGAPFLTG